MSNESIRMKYERLIKLIEDSRYFAARELYNELKSICSIESIETEESFMVSELENPSIQLMLDRCLLCEEAIREYNMENTEDSRWTLGLDLFGYKTHYILEEDNNVLVRVQGSQEHIPLFEQLAVIREIPLYHEWVPFCSKSELLHQISNTDLISTLHIWSPLGVSRDMVIRGFGADCISENGKVLIIAKSVESYPGASLPEPRSSWFHDRAEIKHMNVVFDILSADSCNVTMTFKVNPKLALPQRVLNFLITRLAGVFLYMQQQKAIEVSQNPECAHAESIRNNKEFYYDWLLPKMYEYAITKNWALPPHTPLLQSILDEMTTREDRQSVLEIIKRLESLHIPSKEEISER